MKKKPVIFILALISAIWLFYSISIKEKSQQSDFINFRWLEGEWLYQDDSLSIYEEWEAKDGSIMEGSSVTILNGDTLEREVLRIIKMNLDYFYIANPMDKGPVLFNMVLDSGKTVEFRNEKNKFPARINYMRIDDSIKVSLYGNGKRLNYFMNKQ